MAEKNGYRIFAGLKGSKIITVGADESVFNHTDIQSAVDAAQNNDVILIEPGTYTLTTKLTINKPLSLIGLRPAGDKGVIITSGATLGSEVVLINSVNICGTAEFMLSNIYFLGADLDQNVVKIDNAAMGNYKTKVRFENCILEVGDGATAGYALYVAHTLTGTDNEIQVKMEGERWHQIHGIYFTVADDHDSLGITHHRITNGTAATAIVTNAGDYTFYCDLFGCTVPHEDAMSGGHATQVVRSLHTVSIAGNTYAAADTNDFTGSQTEQIV
jgi:hypothetical protein